MKLHIGYIIMLVGVMTSVSTVSAASSGETIFNDTIFSSVATEISDINNTITDQMILNAPSALVKSTAVEIPPMPINNSYVYSPWELIHRTQMLDGFMWTGSFAAFITPAMYIGTPFGDNLEYRGKDSPYAPSFLRNPSNYSECVTSKSYLSFALGERFEPTDIAEFRAIAKICATKFYSDYFPENTTTTREEFLIMLFTLFGEPMDDSQHFDSANIQSGYETYRTITGPNNNGIALDNSRFNSTWMVDTEISDSEAIQILALYTAYRMGFQGDTLERGQITMEHLQYNVAFHDDNEVIIRIQ